MKVNLTIPLMIIHSKKIWLNLLLLIMIFGLFPGFSFYQTETIQVFKADNDHQFDNSSKIKSINLTPTKIEDLAILCKVWGFIKYYHPSIAKGDYNWDYELFRIMPKIIQSKNDNERDEILSKWIYNLGIVDIDTTIKIFEESKIKIKPDLDWIVNGSLGEPLSKQLVQIKNAKRNGHNYYIDLVSSNSTIFKNERPYYYYKIYSDVGFRLLCLFRYWNTIQYFFPYKNLIDENWDSVLTEFIPKFVINSGELRYKLTVLELIASIHDTHATILRMNMDNVLQTYLGNNYAPIEVNFIEDKAVVVDCYEELLGGKSGLKNGDMIIKVNNKSVGEIIKEKLPIYSASNYTRQLRDIAYDLLRTNDTIISIVYQRGNLKTSTEIKCSKTMKLFSEEKYKNLKVNRSRLLNADIGYLYPANQDSLSKIMEQFKNTKGLIIDMRCYPNWILYPLGNYLMPDSVNFVKCSQTDLFTPGLFSFGNPLKVGKSNDNYYKGKVVIIVNETTWSRAEFTAMAFRVAPKATVIGSQTAGADGTVSSSLFLPGGIETFITGTGIYYPDGKETQRIGIIPDIEVKPTIKGIIEGRDELLEKAIELINKK